MRDAFASRSPSGSAPLAADRFVVQKMATPGVSCVVRTDEDPLFGPVVSFSVAGPPTELLGDIAHRIPPLTDVDVTDLISVGQGGAAAARPPRRGAGAPGGPRRPHRAASRCWPTTCPRWPSLELNPVNARPGGVDVLGAEVVVRPGPRAQGPRRRGADRDVRKDGRRHGLHLSDDTTAIERTAPAGALPRRPDPRRSQRAGYYPALVADVVAVGRSPATRSCPTWSTRRRRSTTTSVRRHITVLALTTAAAGHRPRRRPRRRARAGHEDVATATTESVPLSAVRGVMLTHVVAEPDDLPARARSAARSPSPSAGAPSAASTSCRPPAPTRTATPTTASRAPSPPTTSRCGSAPTPTARPPCGRP